MADVVLPMFVGGCDAIKDIRYHLSEKERQELKLPEGDIITMGLIWGSSLKYIEPKYSEGER